MWSVALGDLCGSRASLRTERARGRTGRRVRERQVERGDEKLSSDRPEHDIPGRTREHAAQRIGIAEYRRDAVDAIRLLSESLRAADRAQNLGGGRYCSAADVGVDS